MLLQLVGFLFSQQGLVFIAILGVLHYFSTYNYKYFAKQGVEFVKPWPLIGSIAPVIFRQINFSDFYRRSYQQFEKSRFYGIFEFSNPAYVIRDPDLIKELGIKYFDNFVNHRFSLDEEADPLFGRNLFSSRDQRWRALRTTLSPAFTGSKMRTMFGLLKDCAERTVKYLQAETERKGVLPELEMKDFFTRYANDCIATSAFGLEINSFVDKDNEFFRQGQKITKFSALENIKFFLILSMPNLMKKLGAKILNQKAAMYLKNSIMETIDYRKKNNITRPDIIQLLLQAGIHKNFGEGTDSSTKSGGNGTKLEWVDDDLVAQCLIFFLAGFDTTSTLFSFLSYELAINPEVQRKVQEEINEVKDNLDGKPITYEALHQMKYLDMVIQEGLRKWPSVPVTDRKCKSNFEIEDYDGRKVTLKPGDDVLFPIVSLNYDPKYFPNPEKFDPERFSEENKHQIDIGLNTFGIGPRMCIGNRFALMEAKCIFYHLLENFNLIPCEKTDIPIQLQMNQFNPVAKNGIWMKLATRK